MERLVVLRKDEITTRTGGFEGGIYRGQDKVVVLFVNNEEPDNNHSSYFSFLSFSFSIGRSQLRCP